MPETDPSTLTATEACAAIRSGQLTVERLARACLERVAARDPEIRAWTTLDPDIVLARARELDRAPVRGPLHGIPVGIKDVIYTTEFPTQHNSPIYQGFHPRLDAASVAILRQAGALIFGKLDTVEFAVNGRRALTRNPRDPARTPGGSSSGSAAAVADRHVPLTLGTQTGGSTIRPASFCGVFAIKPTWNIVSHEGFKVCSASMDTIGWFARSVADLALLADVFHVEEDGPATPVELSAACIAMCRSPVWERAEPATRAAFDEAAGRLRAAGATVVDLDLPNPFERLTALHKVVMLSEVRSAFLPEYMTHRDQLYAEIRGQVENSMGFTKAQLAEAYDIAAACRAAFDRLAAPFTAVLTPSAVGEAPIGIEQTGEAVFNRIWTLLHVPCINIPGFTGTAGLPIGLTLTGPRFSDRRLLRAAAAVAGVFPAAA